VKVLHVLSPRTSRPSIKVTAMPGDVSCPTRWLREARRGTWHVSVLYSVRWLRGAVVGFQSARFQLKHRRRFGSGLRVIGNTVVRAGSVVTRRCICRRRRSASLR
jgi:hypothetical protein